MGQAGQSYRFRIRFHLSDLKRPQRIGLPDHEYVLAENPNLIVLRSDKDGSLSQSGIALLIGHGFATVDDALTVGEAWISVLIRAFSAQHLCADFGDRNPGGGEFSDDFRRRMSRDAHMSTLNDVHGLMVYAENPLPQLIEVLPVTATAVVQGQRLLDTIEHARELGGEVSETERLAFNLLSASLSEESSDARFLMLMMALETLIDQQQRSPEAIALVSELQEMVRKSDISDADRNSIVMSLGDLSRESVGRAGRRLAKTLGGRRYAGMRPTAFFTACYELRSKLVHGHADRPSVDEINQLVGMLQFFVSDLIAGTLVGFLRDEAPASQP